jgi:hypothetical protein
MVSGTIVGRLSNINNNKENHMIDIAITAAVSFMVALVTNVGEEFAKKAGEELFLLVKKKFKGDKESESTLTNFQNKPERYKDVLIDILKEKVSTDKPFGDEIQKIINKTPRINSGTTTQIANGIGNAQASNNSQATSNVTIKK